MGNANDEVSVLTESEKEEFQTRLWNKAEELYRLREPLKALSTELYERSEGLRNSHKISDVATLQGIETDYWRIQEQLSQVGFIESEIEEAIMRLEEGAITRVEIDRLAPEPQLEPPHISKKKRAIMEEAKRNGVDPRESDWLLYREFGSTSTNHLTTGRNRTSISGIYDSYSAADEFFFQTTDTHGGKVSHGKHGNGYITKDGRRIRKA